MLWRRLKFTTSILVVQMMCLLGACSVGSEKKHLGENVVGVVSLQPSFGSYDYFPELTRKHGVFSIEENGTMHSLDSGFMHYQKVHWSAEGVYFSDNKRDVLTSLSGEQYKYSQEKTNVQTALISPENHTYISFYDAGFDGSDIENLRKNVVQVVVRDRDKSRAQKFTSQAINLVSQCGADVVYGLTDIDNFVGKGKSEIAIHSFAKANDWKHESEHKSIELDIDHSLVGGTAPCIDGRIYYLSWYTNMSMSQTLHLMSWDTKKRTYDTRKVSYSDDSFTNKENKEYADNVISASTSLGLVNDREIWLGSHEGTLMAVDIQSGEMRTLIKQHNIEANKNWFSFGLNEKHIFMLKNHLDDTNADAGKLVLTIYDRNSFAELKSMVISVPRWEVNDVCRSMPYFAPNPNY